jgi:4-amino-4-deoxy-L-arabinose transferase-like glycosyltransferase
MVTRNLYRDRATWSKPVVDDIGRPGYFVKEFPAVPLATAAGYRLLGGVHEWLGRLLPALAWLAATPLVVGIAGRLGGPPVPSLAGLWFVIAPLGVVYSRAFMNDAVAVAASIAALAIGFAWRRLPSARLAVLAGSAVAGALLLKPHTGFWIGPALLALAVAPGPPSRRQRAGLLAAAAAGAALAAPWYVHAWNVHRTYPIPGAMVAEGWVDPALWLRAELYRVLFAQELWMVFTPPGAALAVLAVASPRRPRGAEWAALLAWSAGVLLHCFVLATRMFDEPARRTEYYHLAMVPSAGILIALGARDLAERLAARPRRVRAGVLAAVAAAAALSAAAAAREALAVPPRYRRLAADCRLIQSLTSPGDEIAVLADRPGTVLYQCDRRGMALVPSAPTEGGAPVATDATTARLAADLARARYVYVPFPELLAETPRLASELEASWRRRPDAPPALLLYERRRVAAPPP